MGSKQILIFMMILIKQSHMLSHSLSAKTPLNYGDKLEEYTKMSVPELTLSCPTECVCYNVTVDCDFKKLEHFPSKLDPSIYFLSLAGNEISNLIYNSSFERLKYLNVSFNSVQNIDKKWISTLKQLVIFDLSRNSLKSKALEDVFTFSNLTHLNLSFNQLNEINDKMFHHLNQLLSLDISFNNIDFICSNCLQKLSNLKVLNISSNKLSDLRYDWFKPLSNLNVLVLKHNRLKILRNVVFSPLNHLKILDVSQNNIKSLGILSFKGLGNLQHLNVSKNNISSFQDGVFKFLVSLDTLDISLNPFLSINNCFVQTPRIRVLHLNGLEKFVSLTSSSLSGLSQLEYLDVSGSKLLSDVNIKTFTHTKELKHLDLSDCDLKTLKTGVFNGLKHVETIKLGGNPWRCDCYMHWLLLWLSEHSSAHILSPSETFCHSPPSLLGHVLLDALDHDMVCTNASISYYTTKSKFKVGSSAFLECHVEGDPLPSLTWITPQKKSFHWMGLKNTTDGDIFSLPTNIPFHEVHSEINKVKEDRFILMPNGSLVIRSVERGDGGFYTCIASNPLNYGSVSIRLTLDYDYLNTIKIISVLVGLATSFGFLLLTLVAIFIKMILKHFGVKCPCRNGDASPRTQQIRKILESMEHYKKQQLDRLRDNYTCQAQRVKDNCMQQMERLRESYSSQAERLRDIREYGTLQIDRIRENYYFQVQRVRDYSTSQIIRLRENYIFQRNRIRKFSAHHLYKLRENYKLQQQNLNKILENLNIESCRNVCQRTDSIMLDPEIAFENVLVPKLPVICLPKVHHAVVADDGDCNDDSSQISAYFTPDETGSDISSHESDERESLNDVSSNKFVDKTDIVVRMEDAEPLHTTTHIPKQAPYKNRIQKQETRYFKPPHETIV